MKISWYNVECHKYLTSDKQPTELAVSKIEPISSRVYQTSWTNPSGATR